MSATDTRTRILDAAEAAFGAGTYTQARLADIAAEVGMRRPSLLYHFPNKDALYAAVVHRLFDDVRTGFGTVMGQGGSVEAQLEALFGAWYRFLEQRPAFGPIVLRGVVDGQGPVTELMENELIPLLDFIGGWVQRVAAERLPPGLDVRAAIVQLGADSLIRASAGPLQARLWGPKDPMDMTRHLFGLQAR